MKAKPFRWIALPLMLVALVACQPQMALSPQVQWVASSQEWQAQAKDVFAKATHHAQQVAQRYPPEQWAVILDLDETVLNNVQYQIHLQRQRETYTPQNWKKWTDQQSATLVPAASDYIKQVRALGGLVVFVTNRRDIEQLATEQNLAKLGLLRGEDFQLLITRATPYGDSSKEARFAIVPALLEVMGYDAPRVVAYIGDAVGDKPQSMKDAQFFCINQGGMYGDPCALQP